MFHTIKESLGLDYLAEHITMNGEDLFIIREGNKIDDIWKFTIDEDLITKFDYYYCCPKVLEEIAERLNTTANYHGYYYEELHS